MFWNSINLSLLTKFCINKEALWLPVSQAAGSPDHDAWLTPSLTDSLHPLGICPPPGWLLATFESSRLKKKIPRTVNDHIKMRYLEN